LERCNFMVAFVVQIVGRRLEYGGFHQRIIATAPPRSDWCKK
jgi:hypothetical protein